jgi:hypothetical protein
MAMFGRSADGMPRLLVYRAGDGELVIYDGVTRATRIARLLPSRTVPVEVIGNLKSPASRLPTVGDRLR